MSSSWLTTNFVEQIHKAHLKGVPTAAHVAALSNATLAGLVEYGCLRRTYPGLPTLPKAVTESGLGRQLNRITSEIGLRVEGESERPTIDHKPREVEFVTVKDEEELLSEPIQMLAMRITQGMKQAGFSVKTANEFQGACFEMLANAIEHSNSPIPTLVAYHIRPNLASFVVADVGRGVFESLRENPDHQDVADHCEALRRAVKEKVSRHREARGNGFRPVFKALAENWGVLRFRSRKGCRTLDGMGVTEDQGTNHYPPELPGFQVSVTCRSTPLAPAFPVV